MDRLDFSQRITWSSSEKVAHRGVGVLFFGMRKESDEVKSVNMRWNFGICVDNAWYENASQTMGASWPRGARLFACTPPGPSPWALTRTVSLVLLFSGAKSLYRGTTRRTGFLLAHIIPVPICTKLVDLSTTFLKLEGLHKITATTRVQSCCSMRILRPNLWPRSSFSMDRFDTLAASFA